MCLALIGLGGDFEISGFGFIRTRFEFGGRLKSRRPRELLQILRVRRTENPNTQGPEKKTNTPKSP